MTLPVFLGLWDRSNDAEGQSAASFLIVSGESL